MCTKDVESIIKIVIIIKIMDTVNLWLGFRDYMDNQKEHTRVTA